MVRFRNELEESEYWNKRWAAHDESDARRRQQRREAEEAEVIAEAEREKQRQAWRQMMAERAAALPEDTRSAVARQPSMAASWGVDPELARFLYNREVEAEEQRAKARAAALQAHADDLNRAQAELRAEALRRRG
jgi:hypothetical protein